MPSHNLTIDRNRPSEWIMVFDGDGPACGEFAYDADLVELFEQFGFDVIEGYDESEGCDGS